MAKITLDKVKTLLGVEELNFYKSSQSKRLVAYNPAGHTTKFVVMTNDGKFNEKGEIYATILEESEDHPWIGEYDFAIQISNKAGAAPVMTL